MTVRCWNCGISLEDDLFVRGKFPFRALCDRCGSWQHCCCNCKHYRRGLSNDCTIPETEWVADREASNFCEEFHHLGIGPKQAVNPEDVLHRLFGDLEEENK